MSKWSWCAAEDTDTPSTDISAVLERLEEQGNEVVSIVITGERNGKHYYRIFYREPLSQDARIVELAAEVEKRKYFPAQLLVGGGPVVTQVAFDEMKELANARIAELEREIREAHRLLDYAVCLHVRDTDEWGNWCETRMEWIDRDDKRNAERATEQ